MTPPTQLPPGWTLHPQNPAYAYRPDTGEVAPVAQFVVAVLPQPPLPVPAHVPVGLPPGWTQHPQDPRYAYNAQGQVAEVTALATHAPQAPATPQGPVLPVGTRGAESWGEQSLARAEEAATASAASTRDGVLWLDFPDFTGSESSMLLRFLWPWEKTDPGRNAWVESARHRLPSHFVPGGSGQITYVDCPQLSEVPHPVACPICAVAGRLRGANVEGARDLPARKGAIWQVINLSNPQIHYQTINGQSMVVPAVFRVGKTLQDALHNISLSVCNEKKGGSGNHFTSPLAGFPIEVIKKRVQNGKPPPLNIEYDAQHHAHQAGPLDPRLFPTFLYDLTERIFLRPLAELEQIARNIEAALVAAPPAAPSVHGGYGQPASAYGYQPPPPPPAPSGYQAPAAPRMSPPAQAAPAQLPGYHPPLPQSNAAPPAPPPPPAVAPPVYHPPPAQAAPALPAGGAPPLPPPRAPGLPAHAPPLPATGNPAPGMPGSWPADGADDVPF